MEFLDQKLNRIIKILIIVTLVLASLYIFSQFNGLISAVWGALKAVIVPFLIAFFINFLIFPIVIYMEEKGIRPRWIIVSIIYMVIFAILGLIFYFITPIISEQLQDLILNKIPVIYKDVLERIELLDLENNKTLQTIYDQTQIGLQNYFTKSVTGVLTSVKNIFSTILTIILTPIILFYFLKDRNQIGEGFYKIVPVKYKEHFVELTKRVNDTLGLYIRGQIIIMFGIAVLATLGYTLIGLDYAIVFGLIVGITNIIPYMGATIAAVVPVTYSLLAKDAAPWYYILLLNFLFQFVEGNILQPVIMSKQLDIHPLLILAAILGFGSLFGVIGIIFAVPLAGLLKVSILYYREVKEREEIEKGIWGLTLGGTLYEKSFTKISN